LQAIFVGTGFSPFDRIKEMGPPLTSDKIKTMSGLLFKNTIKMIDYHTIDISFSDELEKDSAQGKNGRDCKRIVQCQGLTPSFCSGLTPLFVLNFPISCGLRNPCPNLPLPYRGQGQFR